MKSHENPQFRIPMARPKSHLREGLESATRSPRRRARWDRALDLAHAFLAVQGYDFGGYELCMAFIIFE